MVSHPSSNQARLCFASEVGRDQACSGRHGRRPSVMFLPVSFSLCLVSPQPAFASHSRRLYLSVCPSLLRLPCPSPHTSRLVSHVLCLYLPVCLSLSLPLTVSLPEKNAHRRDGWSIRKRLTGVHLTRETAVARGEGSTRVTFPRAAGPAHRLQLRAECVCSAGPAQVICLLRWSGVHGFHLPDVLLIGQGNRWLGAASGPWTQPGMLGPRPSPPRGPSQGLAPLSGPFCESNVITDRNGDFSFHLSLRGVGSFIRFPRHQAGSGQLGCSFFFFFSPFNVNGIKVRPPRCPVSGWRGSAGARGQPSRLQPSLWLVPVWTPSPPFPVTCSPSQLRGPC